MPKVTFDGINYRMIVNYGVTSLDVKTDLYSDWKEWVQQIENSHWEMAMRAVGGDPTVGSEKLGSTFFLMNGWRIRPYEGDHRLVINGNLYQEFGLSISVPTLGNYKVEVTINNSNLVQALNNNEVAQGVWDTSIENVIVGSFGELIRYRGGGSSL